jgi:hypothetical protein
MGPRVVAITIMTGLGQVAWVHAHHSFDAVFDLNQPVEVIGTVTKVEWTNPHVWFYVTVDSRSADDEEWALEMGSPNALIRRGWTHQSLRVGSEVTVRGAKARDGSNQAAALSVRLATGEELFGGQNQPR